MDFPWLALGVLGTAGIAAAAARLTGQYALAAVAGSAAILWLHGWGYLHYTSDDAYISYRYARNLADGTGLVWNPGEHVEGYSNFLWVMLLALASKLGAEIVPAGRWIGFVLALPALAGTYWLSRDLLDAAAGRAAGLAATLLLAASPPFAVWTFAGLEQSLFVSLMLAAVLLHLREQEGTRIPLSGAAWALVAMTRPEGQVLFAVSGAFKLGEAALRLRTQGGRDREGVAREARLVAAWAIGFAAIYAPYFTWRYAEYGYLFPNTYYAKVGSGLDQYERGLGYLASFAREQAAWLLLLAPAAMALTSIRRARALYVLALVTVWLAYVVYVGGDSLVRYRFFAPVLPLMWALIAASAGALLRAARGERPSRRWAEAAAVALSVAGLIGFLLQSSTDGFTAAAFEGERQAVEDRAEIGRWLRENVPETTTVALIAAGAIPYESRLVTIDMLGINDEHIAHRELDIGRFSAGHEKYDTEYVLDRRPDIIILFDGLTATPMARGDYAAFSRSVIPAAIAAANSERLWQEYEARAVSVGRDRWFNLLVRHEASAVLAKTRSAQDAAAP